MDERENHGFGSFPDSGLYTDANAAADAEFDEFTAWLDREVAAGRNPFPPERALTQGISVSLGAGDGIDQDLLAAVCGIDESGADVGAFSCAFSQGAAADVLPPSPVLAALTEETVPDVRRLSDNQLMGVLQAAQRQENREAWKKAHAMDDAADLATRLPRTLAGMAAGLIDEARAGVIASKG